MHFSNSNILQYVYLSVQESNINRKKVNQSSYSHTSIAKNSNNNSCLKNFIISRTLSKKRTKCLDQTLSRRETEYLLLKLREQDFPSRNPFFQATTTFYPRYCNLQLLHSFSLILFPSSLTLVPRSHKILWDLRINSVSNVISLKCLIAFLSFSFLRRLPLYFFFPFFSFPSRGLFSPPNRRRKLDVRAELTRPAALT